MCRSRLADGDSLYGNLSKRFCSRPTTPRMLILKRRRILSSFEFAAQSRGRFPGGSFDGIPFCSLHSVMLSGHAVEIKQVSASA